MTPRELREYSRALWEEAETYLMAARNDLKKMEEATSLRASALTLVAQALQYRAVHSEHMMKPDPYGRGKIGYGQASHSFNGQ